MNANKSGDPGLSPSKKESQWRWFKMLLFLKSTSNARKMESNMQFQSKQLDRIGSQQSLKKTAALVLTMISLLKALLLTIQYTHQHHRRHLGLLLKRGSRPRSGKCPLEEAMIEIERKKLDLMQSMGNGCEDWDTTNHFLMSL